MTDRPSLLSRAFELIRPKLSPSKRGSRYPPRPLAQRSRALTIDENGSPATSSTSSIAAAPGHSLTFDQAESPLFRLPLELRLQIYTHILGNRIIHLGLETQDEKRLSPYLRHFYCKTGEDLFTVQPSHACWYPVGGRPKDPEERMLSVLKVCRRMYVHTNSFHCALITGTRGSKR